MKPMKEIPRLSCGASHK